MKTEGFGPDQPRDPRREARLSRLVVGAAALAAVLVYANSLANGFAYDDEWIIGGRELVHGLGQAWSVVSSPFWPEGFGSPIYRPLTLLSFAVDWHVWSGAPFGFHLVNVLLHALVTGLVTLFLLRFFSHAAALAGGLVFAVHSVHTEVVANVVGRAELLAACFVLAGCLVYMRSVRGGRVGVTALVWLVICYALAGLSKEAAFVMPLLLLATDLDLVAGAKRRDLGPFVRLRLPTFVALAAVLALLFLARWAVLGSAVGSAPARIFALDDSFATRLFTMARVWPRYLELLVFPLDLSADYSPAVILPASGLTPMGALGFGLVLVAIGAAVVAFRRAPQLTLAVVWLAVTLLPVSNLLFTAETVLGERRLYLPTVAVSLVVGWLVARSRGGRGKWLAAAIGAWVLFFSAVTVQRNAVWRSTDAVFADLLRRHPESSRALFALGLRHHVLGNAAEARLWLGRSLEVWPWFAPYQVKYALVLAEQGELDLAAERARAAIELEPDRIDHHKLLIAILLVDGEPEAALAAIRAARLRLEPDASLLTQQADALFLLGDAEGAARAQEAAIDAGRDDGLAWLRLARFRAAAGDTVQALDALQAGRQAPGFDGAVADSLSSVWSQASAPR